MVFIRAYVFRDNYNEVKQMLTEKLIASDNYLLVTKNRISIHVHRLHIDPNLLLCFVNQDDSLIYYSSSMLKKVLF